MGEKGEVVVEKPGERHSWKRDHKSPRPADGRDPNTFQKPKEASVAGV